MIELDDLLTFELNKNTMIIKNSNYKQVVGMSFTTFFSEVMSEIAIGEVVEKYDYAYVESLVLSNVSESVIFHLKNSPIYYHFISSMPNPDGIITCFLEKRFISDTVSGSNNLDYLSGVYSRAYLISQIQNSIIDADTRDFFFLILDINNFKHINDEYGHRVGDEALRKFAQTLLSLKGDNLLGRFGGDEFIIFCPNYTKEDAAELAKKILNISFLIDESNPKTKVTCCVGMTYSDDKQATFDFLLEKADHALYKAKEKGKHLAFLDDEIIAKTSKNRVGLKNYFESQGNSRLFAQESRARRIKYYIIAVFMVILCVSAVFIINEIIKKDVEKDAISDVENMVEIVSSQVEKNLTKSISIWVSQLENISSNINNEYSTSSDIFALLKNNFETYLSASDFSELAVIKDDGQKGVFCYDNKTFEIKNEYAYTDLKHAIENDINYIISFADYRTAGENQLIVAVPFHKGDIIGVCGIVDSDKLRNNFNVDAFAGEAIISFFKSNGQICVTTGTGSVVTNIINYIKNSSGESNSKLFKEALESGTSRLLTIDLKTKVKYFHISPIIFEDNQTFGNEFRLVFSVPTNKVMSSIQASILNLRIIIVSGLSLMAIIILLMLYFDYKHKNQFFILSSIDNRTKGLNYNRFKKDTQTLISSGKRFSYVYLFLSNYNMLFHNDEEKRNDLLRYVNSLISSYLKSDELVARIYIDRFIFTINNDADHRKRIEKIIDELNVGVFKKYNETLKTIVGVYENRPIDNSNIEYCIDLARLALQKAMLSNKDNIIVYFNDRMLINNIKENALENKAKIALSKGEFILYYQAQRDILNDKWYSAEALVRWKDPIEGLIFPDAFIPLFEKSNLICDLDLYVFERICQYLQRTMEQNKKLLPISVNISGKHLEKANFLDDYYKILSKYSFPHSLIMFELTETVMVENKDLMAKMIDEIHQMGCGCGIDDFGVGYSSFSLITSFNFDEIKLDRSFFNSDKELGKKEKLVVSTIVALCKKLQIRVVCEGVEKLSVVEYLKSIGCATVQGYYYSKPIPEKEYEELIQSDEFTKND